MKNNWLENIKRRKLSRKDFLKTCLLTLCAIPLLGRLLESSQGEASALEAAPFNGRSKRGLKGLCDLAVVQGDDPYKITVKVIDELGGMDKFVQAGDVVVIKPNIGWDRTPEQGANTNPAVVRALIDMVKASGAKKVKIFDVTCNDPRRCYANSGIEEVAKAAGVEVFIPEEWNTVRAAFNYDSPMQGWPVLKDAIECDVFINVPVLKNHSITGLTLSMKNLMGVCSGDRGLIHQDIGRKLVDITDFISPDLTVIDGYRYLKAHGPTGGDLKDVVLLKTIIAGTDPTLCDAYAAQLVGYDPMSIPYINAAKERRFGSFDIDGANKKIVEV